MSQQPGLSDRLQLALSHQALDRKKVYDRVVDKLINFIQRFDDDLGYIEDYHY